MIYSRGRCHGLLKTSAAEPERQMVRKCPAQTNLHGKEDIWTYDLFSLTLIG